VSFGKIGALARTRIDGPAVRAVLDRIAYGPLLRKKIVIGAVAAVGLAVFIFQTISFVYLWDTDSPSYYIAAQGLRRHINIYDDRAFQDLAADVFGKSIIVYPYIYPPLLAQAILPLGGLAFEDYFLALYILNLLLTLLCLYLMADVLDFAKIGSVLPVLFLFVLLIANHPLEITIHHGQINLLVLAFILLSLKFQKSDKPFPAALFLSLAVFIKIYPVLLVLPFLFYKKWKYVFAFAASSAGLFLASLLASGTSVWLDFGRSTLDMALGKSASVYIRGFQSSPNNLSLKGFLGQAVALFRLPSGLAEPAYLLTAACLFLLVLLAARRIGLKSDIPLQGALLLIPTLVLAPLTWSHHYTMMIFPLAYVFGRAVKERRYGAFLPFALGGALILYYPVGGGFPFNQARLFAALGFFIALLLFAKPRREAAHA
jgi:Glycosyltransferase family 87